MTKHDDERLHQLISNHLHYTGSSRARKILDNWAECRPKFVKVMPVEYARAIRELQQQKQAGLRTEAGGVGARRHGQGHRISRSRPPRPHL